MLAAIRAWFRWFRAQRDDQDPLEAGRTPKSESRDKAIFAL